MVNISPFQYNICLEDKLWSQGTINIKPNTGLFPENLIHWILFFTAREGLQRDAHICTVILLESTGDEMMMFPENSESFT